MATTDKILHAIDLAEPPVIGAGIGHLVAGPVGMAAGAAVGGIVSAGLALAKWLEYKQDEEEKEKKKLSEVASFWGTTKAMERKGVYPVLPTLRT